MIQAFFHAAAGLTFKAGGPILIPATLYRSQGRRLAMTLDMTLHSPTRQQIARGALLLLAKLILVAAALAQPADRAPGRPASGPPAQHHSGTRLRVILLYDGAHNPSPGYHRAVISSLVKWPHTSEGPTA
jgi:hypothetical protein